MKCAICYFYIDSVTGNAEAEFIEDKVKEMGTLETWNSPQLTDKRVRYAFGKENVDKLYREYREWIESNDKEYHRFKAEITVYEQSRYKALQKIIELNSNEIEINIKDDEIHKP